MKRIKLVSLILAVTLLLPALFSCKSSDGAKDTGDSLSADTTEVETTEKSEDTENNVSLGTPTVAILEEPVYLETPAMFPIKKVMTPSFQFIENVSNGDTVYFKVPSDWTVTTESTKDRYYELLSDSSTVDRLKLSGPIRIDANTAFDENFHSLTKRMGWDDHSDRSVSFFTTERGYECVLYTKEINKTVKMTAYVKLNDSYILVMEFSDTAENIDLFLSIINSTSLGNLDGSGDKCVFTFSAHGFRSYSDKKVTSLPNSEGREFTVSLPSYYGVGKEKDLFRWETNGDAEENYILTSVANYSQSGFFITRIDDGSSLEEYVKNNPDTNNRYTSDDTTKENKTEEKILSVHTSDTTGYSYCFTQTNSENGADFVYVKTADNYVLRVKITGWDDKKIEEIIYSIH